MVSSIRYLCSVFAVFFCFSSFALASTSVDNLFRSAVELESKATHKAALQETIQAYENVLQEDPRHLESLNKLGHLYLLLGDGYEKRVSKKKVFFRKAVSYNELAMYWGNAEFRKKIDAGAKLWQAADSLTLNDMGAMHFWVTGTFYYFKECLGFWGQVFNYKKLKRAKIVMDRMTEIDPDWGSGMLHFSWGCYYLSIPEFIGGDRVKARAYFEKAVSHGQDCLIFRWGRAKYFHLKMQDSAGMKEDLKWVIDQNIADFKDPFPWKVFFQKDAQLTLDNFDAYYTKRRKFAVE